MANKFFSFFSKKEQDPQEPEKKESQQPASVQNPQQVPAQQPAVITPQLLSFLNQFPSVLLLADASGAIRFANARAAQLLGYTQNELKMLKVDKFALTVAEINDLLKDPSKKLIKELVNKDLNPLYANISASLLAGTPYIMLAIDDIPQYRQLQGDKRFLSSIVNNYPFAVAVQDQAGECVLWNHKAEELFGRPAAQTLNKPIYESLPADLASALQRLDKDVVANAKSVSDMQMSFKTSQNKECTLSVTKVPTFDVRGRLQAILTVFENITERKGQERQLTETRNLLRAVVDHVPLGLYTRTIDGEMTFFNKQSQVVFNEMKPEFVNSPHPKQTQEQVDLYARREKAILEEGKLKDFPDEIYTDGQGNQKIIHMIKVPLKQAGPEPLVLSIVEDVTKRREQEREIFSANSFLSAIVNNAPIGLYARSKTGKMLLRNKKCEEIFGAVTSSEFDNVGSLPHESKELVDEYMGREHKILESGELLDIPEEEYITADGQKRVVHLIKVPVADVDGVPGFVITLAEDITEKKAQERELIEAKNFQQTMLDNAPIAIYARGLDDKMFFVNKRARELFPDETEYVAKDDFYGHREKAIFQEGKIVEFPEEWYTNFRGRRMLLHLIKAPVFDKEGKPFMVLTIAEDITEKKMQEQEIIKAKNFLQTVINNLPLALSVKNEKGEYILWNKKSEDLFGVTAQDVIGKLCYRTDITKEQAEFLSEADMKVYESRKEQNIPQELISTASEGVKIMHTVKTPVFKEDGSPDCLLSISEDITVKTKMEKQIREASDKNSLLVENAREGILILEDFKVIYANRAVCKMLGYDSVDDLLNHPVSDFVSGDHQMFVREKYEAVLNDATGSAAAIDVHFLKKNGSEAEAEFAAMASKYLGRRIVICFVRDVTSANQVIRDIKSEREKFRSAFMQSVVPSFILTYKGYISVMNEACRKLFNFTEADRNFYRNVYMRPALSLRVRNDLKEGKFTQMDYVFDFDKAKEKFPDRIEGSGKLPLRVSFVPINKRDSKDGTVEADYVVYLERLCENASGPAAALLPPPPAPQVPHAPKAPQPPFVKMTPPPPPVPVLPKDKEMMLPNTEPYALCTDGFKIEQCNDLFCSLCQLGRDELVGQDILKIFDLGSVQAVSDDLKTLARTGGIENRDHNINLASGLETVAVRITAVKEADGRYLFVLRNMAFHRQIMKILEERSAQLNALLEATDGVVFSVAFEDGRFGKIQQANKFLSRMLGYTHDELVRMRFEDLFAGPEGAGTDGAKTALKEAAPQLAASGKAAFKARAYRKDGEAFEAEVVATPLDLPDQNCALVVIRDLSAQLDVLSKDSKEALELKSVRNALPGLYLKTDNNGRVLEVYSNLPYLDNEAASNRFLDKAPAEYFGEEAAARELFAVKEALSININTSFEFDETFDGKKYYYESTVTPIAGREEAVIWIKDVTDRHAHEAQIHELYSISNETDSTITEQVDKILDFGKRVFNSDIGFVARFNGARNELMTVVYATKNDYSIERYMVFPVEECLLDVADDNIVLHPNLAASGCQRCIHKEKDFHSLIAAPLYVGGKVAGALCFASRNSRREFVDGAEELIGIMARLLSLRIELREAGKTISETAQSLARTLEYVDLPAVMIDLDYRVTYANGVFLNVTGRRVANVRGRDFFEEFIRNEDISKRMFKSAENSGSGKAFQVKLDLLYEDGRYVDTGWDVFVQRDADGEPEGYALIGIRH